MAYLLTATIPGPACTGIEASTRGAGSHEHVGGRPTCHGLESIMRPSHLDPQATPTYKVRLQHRGNDKGEGKGSENPIEGPFPPLSHISEVTMAKNPQSATWQDRRPLGPRALTARVRVDALRAENARREKENPTVMRRRGETRKVVNRPTLLQDLPETLDPTRAHNVVGWPEHAILALAREHAQAQAMRQDARTEPVVTMTPVTLAMRAVMTGAGWGIVTELTRIVCPPRTGTGPTLPVARYSAVRPEPGDSRTYSPGPWKGNPRQGKLGA